MTEIDIKITDDTSRISYKVGVLQKNKTVRTGDLINAISDITGYNSPILPPNTRFFKINKQNIVLALEIPPMIRRLNYIANSKTVFDNVLFPFPWELMILTLNEVENGNFNLVDTRLFALKNPIISLKDDVFRFVTPNVYKDDGRVCWGEALSRFNLGKVDNLAQAYKYVSLFHDATFNTDLHPALNNNEKFEDLVRRLKDKPAFDTNAMVPWKNVNETMEGIVYR